MSRSHEGESFISKTREGQTLEGVLSRDIKAWEVDLARYEHLIGKHENDEKTVSSTSSTDSWAPHLPQDAHRIMKECVEDGILVDLGGGYGRMEKILRTAQDIHPRLYVNVDSLTAPRTGKRWQFGGQILYQYPVWHSPEKLWVRADILDFLIRAQDESVDAFSANALDSIILPLEYLEAVAEQITRVLRVGGIFLGATSTVASILLDAYKDHYEVLHPEGVKVGDDLDLGVGLILRKIS